MSVAGPAGEAPRRDAGRERRAEIIIVAAFMVSVLAALGLAVVYWRGGQPQLEGSLLAVAGAGHRGRHRSSGRIDCCRMTERSRRARARRAIRSRARHSRRISTAVTCCPVGVCSADRLVPRSSRSVSRFCSRCARSVRGRATACSTRLRGGTGRVWSASTVDPSARARRPGERSGHGVPGRRAELGDGSGGAGSGRSRRHSSAPGARRLDARGIDRVLQGLHARGLPGRALRGDVAPAAVPVPSVDVRRPRRRGAGVRARGRAACRSCRSRSTPRVTCTRPVASARRPARRSGIARSETATARDRGRGRDRRDRRGRRVWEQRLPVDAAHARLGSRAHRRDLVADVRARRRRCTRSSPGSSCGRSCATAPQRPTDGPVSDNTWIVWGGVVVPVVDPRGARGRHGAGHDGIATSRRPTRSGCEVVGKRWWWQVSYPGTGFTTANEIHLPAGRPVEIGLDSDNVIHSFWVPELAGKVDMIPGQHNVLRFTPRTPGTYIGECAEFCGLEHAPHGLRRDRADRHRLRPLADAARAHAVGARLGSRDRGRDRVHARSRARAATPIRGTPAHGNVGPDLTDFGERSSIGARTIANTPSNLATWISDAPQREAGRADAADADRARATSRTS